MVIGDVVVMVNGYTQARVGRDMALGVELELGLVDRGGREGMRVGGLGGGGWLDIYIFFSLGVSFSGSWAWVWESLIDAHRRQSLHIIGWIDGLGVWFWGLGVLCLLTCISKIHYPIQYLSVDTPPPPPLRAPQ